MVDDDGAIDVFVAEADGLLGFEADDEISCGIGARGRAVPDGEGETLVVVALAVEFGGCHGVLDLFCEVVVRIRGVAGG